MAGDWIKMSKGLQTHPKVVRISSALKTDRLRTVGALHAVWSLFDEHSEDGSLVGYDAKSLDEYLGWDGFALAMESVGWLDVSTQGVSLPRYTDHNGSTAKRRALDAARKGEVRKKSACDADRLRNREEKRREEKSTSSESRTNSESLSAANASRRFTKPTLEDVTAYCRERKNHVDPQAWLDHYESNGWRVGRNPMKDWKAAVRTWERTAKPTEPSRPRILTADEVRGVTLADLQGGRADAG